MKRLLGIFLVLGFLSGCQVDRFPYFVLVSNETPHAVYCEIHLVDSLSYDRNGIDDADLLRVDSMKKTLYFRLRPNDNLFLGRVRRDPAREPLAFDRLSIARTGSTPMVNPVPIREVFEREGIFYAYRIK